MSGSITNVWVDVCSPGAPALPEGRWRLSADGESWLFCSQTGQKTQEICEFPREKCCLTKEEPDRTPMGRKGLLDQYDVTPIRMQMCLPSGERVTLSTACNTENIRMLSDWGLSFLPVYDLLDRPDAVETIVCVQGADLLPDGARLDVWREQDELFMFKQDMGIYSSKRTLQYGRVPVHAIRSVRQSGEIEQEAYQIPGIPGGIRPGKAALIGALLSIFAGILGTLILSIFGLIAGIAVGVIGGIYFASEEGTPARTEYRENDMRRVSMELDRPDGGVATILFQKEAWEPLHRLLTSAEMQGGAGRHPQEQQTLLDQLERLSSLYEKGYLTQPEFEQAKAKLLAQI